MGNCLVTKLKASVNNTDLYKIDELRMFLPAGSVMRLDAGGTVVSEKEFTVTALEGSFSVASVTYNTGSPYTFPGSGTHNITVPANADAVISISDKQVFNEIYFNSGDRVSSVSGKYRAILNPDFGYLMNLARIEAYMKFDCDTLGYLPLLENLGRSNYYQQFSSNVWRKFVNHDNLPIVKNIVARSLNPSDQVNIKCFASLITLLTLRCTADIGFVGALEDLAQGMVNAGRTSGSLSVHPNSQITYNGEACDNSKTYTITFENGSYTVAVS